MKLLFTLCLALMFISVIYCASPVFLAAGGAKICTLNNVGSLPAANNPSVKYPVYRKVCRAVVPTALGDQIDDEDFDEEVLKIETASKKLRRAIINE